MEHPEGSGLVPITIGANAVDPVTAELSPVIGVRTNPETGVVIPVTLASGGHKHRKAPLGSIIMSGSFFGLILISLINQSTFELCYTQLKCDYITSCCSSIAHNSMSILYYLN